MKTIVGDWEPTLYLRWIIRDEVNVLQQKNIRAIHVGWVSSMTIKDYEYKWYDVSTELVL